MLGKRTWWQSILLYSAVLFWCFIVLFPFYWLLVTSFKQPLAVSRGPRYIPCLSETEAADGTVTKFPPFCDYTPTGEHWSFLFDRQWDKTRHNFRNSLIISGGSTLLATAIGAMAGYALSRFKYYWGVFGWDNQNIAFWIISNRFLPPALFVVPFFMLYFQIGIRDTHLGIIVIYTMFNVPFSVWILRDFFNGLPIELEESAMVDGATRWQAFFRIVLPLSAPGLVSVAILAFIFSWNDYLYSFMLSDFDATTIPPFLVSQNTNAGTQWWYISALSLTAVAPVVLIGLFMERYITRGLVAGAIKG